VTQRKLTADYKLQINAAAAAAAAGHTCMMQVSALMQRGIKTHHCLSH